MADAFDEARVALLMRVLAQADIDAYPARPKPTMEDLMTFHEDEYRARALAALAARRKPSEKGDAG